MQGPPFIFSPSILNLPLPPPSSAIKMDDGSKANDYHVSFKCVLVGSQGVGKTTLLDGEVPNGGSSGGGSTTVGINFQLKFYSLKGMTYRVVFWDTPGSERHLKLTSRYAAGSAVAVLVFDVNKVRFGFGFNSWGKLLDSFTHLAPVLSLAGSGKRLTS